MTHGGALVNHLDAVFLEDRQPFLRVVAGGFHRLDATLDDGLDIAGVVRLLDRGQEGQVDAERLVGHFPATADFLGQRRRSGLGQCGNHAQAAGIGHGGGQFGIADMVHAALNDRVLDTKQFSDSCFHAVPVQSKVAYS